MGRPKRITLGGYAYHVLNRANGRLRIFRKDGDFSINRGAPLGEPNWIKRTAARLALESTTKPRGRPKKGT